MMMDKKDKLIQKWRAKQSATRNRYNIILIEQFISDLKQLDEEYKKDSYWNVVDWDDPIGW